MRLIKCFISGLVVCGIALAMASVAQAQNAKDIPAKVVRIKGSAQYATDNKTWHALKVDQILTPGTVIQTGEASVVDIILGDGGVEQNPPPLGSQVIYNPTVEQNLVRLSENTVMALDKLTQTDTGADTMTDTQLDLRAGRIFGTVKKLSATSRYEIKIPNGVAGIRGTIYMVSAVGVIDVFQGSILISYVGADGTVKTQEVLANWEFDTRTGQMTPLADLPRGELINFAWESRLFVSRAYVFPLESRLLINRNYMFTPDNTGNPVSPH